MYRRIDSPSPSISREILNDIISSFCFGFLATFISASINKNGLKYIPLHVYLYGYLTYLIDVSLLSMRLKSGL